MATLLPLTTDQDPGHIVTAVWSCMIADKESEFGDVCKMLQSTGTPLQDSAYGARQKLDADWLWVGCRLSRLQGSPRKTCLPKRYWLSSRNLAGSPYSSMEALVVERTSTPMLFTCGALNVECDCPSGLPVLQYAQEAALHLAYQQGEVAM